MNKVKQAYVGIDIAKRSFDVAVARGPDRWSGTFANNREGHRKLHKWLKKHKIKKAKVVMEATGLYGMELAKSLHRHGYWVAIVNPYRIKAYGESQLLRNITDRIAAEVIAHFCQTQEVRRWTPPAPELEDLRTMTRYLESLKQMRTSEVNRSKAGIINAEVLGMMEDHIGELNERIRDLEQLIDALLAQHEEIAETVRLLETIPGIGHTTAVVLVAEIQDISMFPNARALAAFAGLTPTRHRSGTTIDKKPHLSKMGRTNLRTALYLPSLSACRYNPLVRELSARLRAKGKASGVIRGAAMRKLLHLVYGVWKNREPFDPMYEVRRGRKSAPAPSDRLAVAEP